MTYLISEVKAQEAVATDPAKAEFSFTSFIPLILIFAVFYFLIIRPQSKKMKEHKAMVDALKKGDKVITSGGILGVVKEVDTKADLVEVEIADDVSVRILRSHVADLMDKKEEKKPNKKSKK